MGAEFEEVIEYEFVVTYRLIGEQRVVTRARSKKEAVSKGLNGCCDFSNLLTDFSVVRLLPSTASAEKL